MKMISFFDLINYLIKFNQLGNYTLLEWQLRNIRANAASGVTNMALGIRYYNIVDNPDTKTYKFKEDTTQQQTSLRGLVVFIYQASALLQNTFPQFCKEKVVHIVQERNLPFILCLKYTDIEFAERSTKSEHIMLLQKAMESLQTSLERTHLLIMTEPLFRKRCYLVTFKNIMIPVLLILISLKCSIDTL